MKDKYSILFKTGDAELRALEKSNINISKVFPIIELTRGRKSKYDNIGLLNKRLDRLDSIFNDSIVCFDLTSDSSLSNSQIDELYLFENGYENWINFLIDIKINYSFKEIVPVILINVEDEDFDVNLLSQVKALSNNFKKLAYRNNISDDGYLEDLQIFSKYINLRGNDFIFILDCEYVPSGAVNNVVEIVKARINKVKKLIPLAKIILVSTSFPRYVSDIGNDDHDIFPLNEIRIFNEVTKKFPEVSYGDYGSINPTRNDTIVMSRGWIPRIDVPSLSGIYYYRVRNKIKDYSKTYIIVANLVVKDSNFPLNSKSWGVRQIILCKDGNSPGSSPSFWISVRMSIFIELQLKRLNLL